MRSSGKIILMLVAGLMTAGTKAAAKDVLLPYGDMNRWTVRKIHESADRRQQALR